MYSISNVWVVVESKLVVGESALVVAETCTCRPVLVVVGNVRVVVETYKQELVVVETFTYSDVLVRENA